MVGLFTFQVMLGHQGYEYVDLGRLWQIGKFLGIVFWLVLMLFTSLLPVGIIQFIASASEGLWYARSEAFMQSDILQTLRWVRTIGDVVFIVGALAVTWQVVKGVFFPDLEPVALETDESGATSELSA